MNRSILTALAVAGVVSVSSLSAYSSSDAPVDKGGMPPSTEMKAGSGPENALPPGSIGGGNGDDASGSSTSPGSGSGSMSGGGARESSVNSGSERSGVDNKKADNGG